MEGCFHRRLFRSIKDNSIEYKIVTSVVHVTIALVYWTYYLSNLFKNIGSANNYVPVLQVLWFHFWHPSHWRPSCLGRPGCLQVMQLLLDVPFEDIFEDERDEKFCLAGLYGDRWSNDSWSVLTPFILKGIFVLIGQCITDSLNLLTNCN